MATRYLVVRTDREQQKFIMRELEEGRLRQGWGYDPSQDLRRIKRKVEMGKDLTEDEADAWRNRRLLDTESDGVQPGDVLLLPNLPQDGWWVLARVAGPYTFAISDESSGAGRDYGHIVKVEPIRSNGAIARIDPYNEHVDARLRSGSAAGYRGRMCGIDALGEAVEKLIVAIEKGDDTKTAQPEVEKVDGVFKDISKAAFSAIQKRFQGAEFEKLVHELFQRVYVNGKVEHWGGPGERGADLIVFTRDALGLEYKLAVQVKLHTDVDDDTTALDQISEASKVHRVHAGVVVTTAEKTSKSFDEKRDKLSDDLGIAIRVLTRDDFVALVLRHMAEQVV